VIDRDSPDFRDSGDVIQVPEPAICGSWRHEVLDRGSPGPGQEWKRDLASGRSEVGRAPKLSDAPKAPEQQESNGLVA